MSSPLILLAELVWCNVACSFFLDKANRLDVGNAENPRPSDEDKKLVVVKSPNAVNPLVWDYSVSILKDYNLPNSCSDIEYIIKKCSYIVASSIMERLCSHYNSSLLYLMIFVDFMQPLLTIDVWEVFNIFKYCS